MNAKFLFSLTLTITLGSCSYFTESFVENKKETISSLDGSYKGIFIREWKNSYNGNTYGSADTLNLEFSLSLPNFSHGNCTGQVVPLDDAITFLSDECTCWCDCNPFVDCGGDVLLGSRTYNFDGDSLHIWAITNWVDTIQGYYFNRTHKELFLLKKM